MPHNYRERPAMAGRRVIQCGECELVQFPTKAFSCRRCGVKFLDEEPIAAVPEEAPAAPVTPIGNSSLRLPDRPSGRKASLVHESKAPGLDLIFAIRIMRAVHGYSQPDLALRRKTSRTFISKLENGKCTPHHETIERLARAFEVTPRLFMEVATMQVGQ